MRLKNNEEALIERIERAVANELERRRRQSGVVGNGATADTRGKRSSTDSENDEATAA